MKGELNYGLQSEFSMSPKLVMSGELDYSSYVESNRKSLIEI